MCVMINDLSRSSGDGVSWECEVVIELSFSVVGSFFFQAEDGIRDLVRSRGLGDVYKRQLAAKWVFQRSQSSRIQMSWHYTSVTQMKPSVLALSLIHI